MMFALGRRPVAVSRNFKLRNCSSHKPQAKPHAQATTSNYNKPASPSHQSGASELSSSQTRGAQARSPGVSPFGGEIIL